jgi:hypothetical protein
MCLSPLCRIARPTSLVIAQAIAIQLCLAAPSFAQTTIGSASPRSVGPGKTTRLEITGGGFGDSLRVFAGANDAKIDVVAVAADKATLDITLPADSPMGPMGLWVASDGGPSDAFVLIVDDLPSVVEEAANTSAATAQAVSPLVGIDGASKGAQGSFFKFSVAADQRVAFEVLTQPLDSNMDPVVRLYNAAGETLHLGDDDEIGPDCRFAYQFTEAGDYVIEVRDNRYTAGGLYRLRIGDFPILRHAFPLAVTAGVATPITFVGADGAAAEPRTVTLNHVGGDAITTVATRLPGGQSSAWVPMLVTPLATAAEPATASDPATTPETVAPLSPPVQISGRLSEPKQVDRIAIQGTQGTTARFRARTRSLASPTLLKMRLLGDADAQVAEAKVGDTDETTFDFAFPDTRVYTLEVTDLLGRGGDGFGYCVEIAPAGSFAIQTKADAALHQQFAVEPGHGAAPIDLQIQRFGYDGAIELSLVDAPAGLKIVNPTIPAAAAEARVYLSADAQWDAAAIAPVRIVGKATGSDVAVMATSTAWQRIKRPHVPFPIHWRDGRVLLGGVAPVPSYFTLQPAAPIRLARPVAKQVATLNLGRLQEDFKAGVVVMADSAPTGWQTAVAAEGDVHTVTWTRPADALGDTTAAALRLLAFAEHQGRGRIETIELPVTWFDPVRVTVAAKPAGDNSQPMRVPFVAGQKVAMVVSVERDGDDPQPVTLTLSGLADQGLSGPESITIAVDQSTAEFEVAVVADAKPAQRVAVSFVASSVYREQAFSIPGQSEPLPFVAAPVSIEVFPLEIALTGTKDRSQIVVTGYDELQTPRDWTRDAAFVSADPAIAEVRGTTVFPVANGETRVTVTVGAHRYEIPVRVTATDVPHRTAFESEVLVALSKQGCNSGACHGSPSGKGMFRLSLRAFDAKLDELTLIREDYGRRLNPIAPEQSLLILKPLMKVSHGGGKQLKPTDEAYAILRDWVAEGAKADPAGTPRVTRLEVLPSSKRVLRLEGGPQQIAAIAHFSDGTRRDVTHLVAYESSDMSVAKVDASGLVTPMKRGESVILVRFLEHIESVPLMFIQQVPDFVWSAPEPVNYVDELVNAKLHQLQYVPSETCTDAEFVRRVHLDLIGILPSVETAKAFLTDESSDKRSRLIDELLTRDEFAKFWALKWGDLLKMTGKVVGDDGVYKYHRWVEEAFRTNMPYDEFARQLLTTSGSTLSSPPANFYRTATDMNECVENVSQVFLGARLQCAKCHNHPFERWTQDNYYGLGAFFNRVQRRNTERPGEMFVYTSTTGDVVQPRTGEVMKPWLPVRGSIDVAPGEDPRDSFAEWLIEPSNPFFAKMEANRIWAQLFARGIVDPIDDFRDSNPPTNEAVLGKRVRPSPHLASDFEQSDVSGELPNDAAES